MKKFVLLLLILLPALVYSGDDHNLEVQNICKNKFSEEQKALKCIADQFTPIKSINVNGIEIKIHRVPFSGYGTAWILTPKNSDLTSIVEIDGKYIYGSVIYNLETCCESRNPVLVMERFETKNSDIEDCRGKCSTKSRFYAYRLNSLKSLPALIDIESNFTNQTTFGPLVSNDMTYKIDSLFWDEKESSLKVLARFHGDPKGNFLSLSLYAGYDAWTLYVRKE